MMSAHFYFRVELKAVGCGSDVDFEGLEVAVGTDG